MKNEKSEIKREFKRNEETKSENMKLKQECNEYKTENIRLVKELEEKSIKMANMESAIIILKDKIEINERNKRFETNMKIEELRKDLDESEDRCRKLQEELNKNVLDASVQCNIVDQEKVLKQIEIKQKEFDSRNSIAQFSKIRNKK